MRTVTANNSATGNVRRGFSRQTATPASFRIGRMRIAPGGHLSVPADDPGLVLIYMESGTSTGMSTTPTSVLRVARLATPEAPSGRARRAPRQETTNDIFGNATWTPVAYMIGRAAH